MNRLLKQYQDYAFLAPAADERSGSQRYDSMLALTTPMISRSHEPPNQWWFVVFSPLDHAYSLDEAFFAYKGLSKCRDLFKHPLELIMSREILDCKKIHINALVCCPHPPKLNNKNTYCNKYYADVQPVPGQLDRERIRNYLCKEALERPFEKYLDYLTYSRI